MHPKALLVEKKQLFSWRKRTLRVHSYRCFFTEKKFSAAFFLSFTITSAYELIIHTVAFSFVRVHSYRCFFTEKKFSAAFFLSFTITSAYELIIHTVAFSFVKRKSKLF